MVKDTNGKAVKWIGITITILVIFATIVGTWVTYGERISRNSSDIVTLWEGGSKQANKNAVDIILIQKDLSIIQKAQSEMRSEQKKGFDQILERLPK